MLWDYQKYWSMALDSRYYSRGGEPKVAAGGVDESGSSLGTDHSLLLSSGPWMSVNGAAT